MVILQNEHQLFHSYNVNCIFSTKPDTDQTVLHLNDTGQRHESERGQDHEKSEGQGIGPGIERGTEVERGRIKTQVGIEKRTEVGIDIDDWGALWIGAFTVKYKKM